MALAFSGNIKHGDGSVSSPRSYFDLNIYYDVYGDYIQFFAEAQGTLVSTLGSYKHYLYLTIYVNGQGYQVFSGNQLGSQSGSGGYYTSYSFSNSITTPLLEEGTSAGLYAESTFNQGGSSGSWHDLDIGDDGYAPSFFTISYNANGGSGTTDEHIVEPDDYITLRYNNFTPPKKAAHSIYLKNENGQVSTNGVATWNKNEFDCWGLNSSTGTNYSPGDYYGPIDEDAEFYAKWRCYYTLGSSTKSPTQSTGYKVIFDAESNGGTSATPSITSTKTTTYTFYKWYNTSTGTYHSPNTTVNNVGSLTFRESWNSSTKNDSIKLPTAYKTQPNTMSMSISLNANKGVCDIKTLSAIAPLTYDFIGWYYNGTKIGDANDDYTPNSEITLTADFKTNIGTFSQILLPTPKRIGYKFMGWSNDINSKAGVMGYYHPTLNDTILYAIWKPNGIIRISNGEDMNQKAQIFIFNDGKWNLAQSHTYIDKWKINGG